MTRHRAPTSTRGTTLRRAHRRPARLRGARPVRRRLAAPRWSRWPAACRSSPPCRASLVTGAIDRVMRDDGAGGAAVRLGQGAPELREQILRVMALEGIRGSADDVVVTTGSQQALDLVTQAVPRPGRRRPRRGAQLRRRHGHLPVYQADIVHVAMDERRPDPRGAARAHRAAQGRRAAPSSSSTRSPTSTTRPASR